MALGDLHQEPQRKRSLCGGLTRVPPDVQIPPPSGQLQHHSLSLDTPEDLGHQEEETSLKGWTHTLPVGSVSLENPNTLGIGICSYCLTR